MSPPPDSPPLSPAALQAHLLARVGLEDCLALQERVAREAALRDDGRITVLVAEHPPSVTIGRGGSPAALQAGFGLLRQRRVEVRWVKRGGGCLVHAPGQLAVYSIAPLAWHGFTLGEYLARLQAAIVRVLSEIPLAVRLRPDGGGILGRTGQLASFALAVRDGVTRHGAFINVDPALGLFRVLESGMDDDPRPSSLVAERRGPVKMTLIKAELVRHLTAAFGCDRYHVHTGHPWLRAVSTLSRVG